MKRRTVLVLAASVAAVAFGAALVGGVALLLRQQGHTSGSSLGWSSGQYLDIELSGELPEQPPVSLSSLFDRNPPSLRTIVQSLDRAATDSRVHSVLLRVGVLDAGWGKIEEVRDAILRFRKSGKPAFAHIEAVGNKEYYLATACSKIYAVPTGLLDVTGLVAEVMFFRNTLDKLGVQAQFEGIGKYKNAPNQFTEEGFTEPHREQVEALTDSLYARYVKGIAEARGMSIEEARALIDQGPFGAREAKKARLVDDLLYHDQLDEQLEDLSRVTPSRYTRSSHHLALGGRPKVAVVYVVGTIVLGRSQDGPFGGGGAAGSDTIAAAIRSAREDDAVKAIILRIDSPGGSGTASDVIWREVREAQKAKPVIASMGDVAASGGYYVAMGSSAIVAQPGTITGSIGVFGGKFSLRGLYDKIGVTMEIVARGKNAALFTEYRPWSDEERLKVRSLVASFYEDFVTKAAEGRGRSYDAIHAVAQGRVWTGSDAAANGLVDRLGGLETALALAKEKAKISKEQEVDLIVLPEPKGFIETLLDQDDGRLESQLPSELVALVRWAHVLQSGLPTARLPFELRIH